MTKAFVAFLVACGGTSGSPGGPGASPDAAPQLRTVKITFDELSPDTKVTTQYAPDVTFASKTGDILAYDPGEFGQSKPNFICTGSGDCATDLTLTFTHGVRGISFDALGVNDTGAIATVQLTPGGSVPIVGQGMVDVPVHVDLSTFTGVTSLVVTNITDAAGIGYDNFTFEAP